MDRRRPTIWATYATEEKAQQAMNSNRFGAGPWWIEYRKHYEPYPWCLMTDKHGP